MQLIIIKLWSFVHPIHAGLCDYTLLNGSGSVYILNHNKYGESVVNVGATVSFNCSQPGEVPIGSNTVTCTEGGQWEPELNQLQMRCKGEYYD